jgi:hypothetical protein
VPPVLFDIVLGALGIGLTLAAAREFGHKNVRNRASGTLDEDATVSYDEMIEHAFYQVLNLCQALFVAYVSLPSTSLISRAFCACACSAPWLFRSAFPVHSFSKNYGNSSRCSLCLSQSPSHLISPPSLIPSLHRFSQSQFFIIRFLYRIKKWQCVSPCCVLLQLLLRWRVLHRYARA